MIENGFYKIKQEFVDLIIRLGGTYRDKKERPVFCCFEDKNIQDLFWAIPTSDYAGCARAGQVTGFTQNVY